ncbi:MAG TPA: glycosyltransferase [Puia sp.]|nr:glycosyltransferase [Puia sp.]
MSTKKKILVLVDWFAPGYRAGGPIQSCVNFAYAMRGNYEVSVLTTDTDHGETAPYPGIPAGRWIDGLHAGFRVNYLPKASLSKGMIRSAMLDADADYVYLNHLFSPLFVVYPLWLKYRGQLRSEVVVCPRGALYDSALSVKPWKKTPFLTLFRLLGIHKKVLFHATNQREKEAIERFFPGSKILIADNLPNTNQPEFVVIPKQPGMLKAVFIARIHPIKNLLFLLQALRAVTATVELTVIGPMEDRSYWESCQAEIARLPAHVRVDYLGPKRNDELMPVLQAHHLFILPTTGENFGHAIFEALLAGRPVLISDQTPWLGMPAFKAGWDLPLNDVMGFTRVIEEAAGWDEARFGEWARGAWNYARNFIKNPELQNQYYKLFA